MQPHIKFKLNKELDKKIALLFLNVKAGGIDFSNCIIDVHPELKRIKKKNQVIQKKIIGNYFDTFYQKYKDYLRKRTKDFQKDWNKIEKKYFKTVARVFKNHLWPKGDYIGYLSIVNCNPRFIKNKTFQVFYFHPEGVVSVVAHELLHFIFYDYCLKNHAKIFKKLNTDKGIFWDLAEIFNAVILSQPEFIKIHQIKRPLYYPAHKKYFSVLKSYWQKFPEINGWVIKSYTYLKNKN